MGFHIWAFELVCRSTSLTNSMCTRSTVYPPVSFLFESVVGRRRDGYWASNESVFTTFKHCRYNLTRTQNPYVSSYLISMVRRHQIIGQAFHSESLGILLRQSALARSLVLLNLSLIPSGFLHISAFCVYLLQASGSNRK